MRRLPVANDCRAIYICNRMKTFKRSDENHYLEVHLHNFRIVMRGSRLEGQRMRGFEGKILSAS